MHIWKSAVSFAFACVFLTSCAGLGGGNREQAIQRELGDFESGTLGQWEVIWGDLDPQPVTPSRGGIDFAQSGEHFIGTGDVDQTRLERFSNPEELLHGELAGIIRSKPFIINLPYLTFLIGGGYNPPDLCLRLVNLRDGSTLRTATGWENETMHRRFWDVSDLEGEVCRLEIVDRTRSPRWGHLNVDDIRLVNQAGLDAVSDVARADEFLRVYDPGIDETRPWYINDHCIIRGPDDLWHMFGITHFDPPNPLDEDHLAHATASDLWDIPWDKQPFVLDVVEEPWGETHLWAPHVVENDGLYYMYYCGGGASHEEYMIQLATSRDLWNWERHPENPLVVDGYDARDPFVTRIGDEWVMYYTATSEPAEGNHIVAAVTSTDLIHWGNRRTVMNHPSRGKWGGPTESPVVVQRGDQWYLFIGPAGGYDGTDVYVSDDPFEWTMEDKVAFIPSHAAEVVRDVDGSWVVTRAGWRRGGLHLAPLIWNDGLDEAETNFPVPE